MDLVLDSYFTKLVWSLDWIGLKWNLNINSGNDRKQFGKFICHFHIDTVKERKYFLLVSKACALMLNSWGIYWWLIPKVVWEGSSLHLNTLVTGLKQTLHTQRHPISSISDISFTCPFLTQQSFLLWAVHRKQLSWARYKTELMLI